MQKHLKLLPRFLLLTASAIATYLTTATPSQAATYASSEAGFQLQNFSVSPLNVETFTNTSTEAISFNNQGQVNADALANANFSSLPKSSETFANNISLTQAAGQGKNYFGIAESLASAKGYDFQVAPGGIFSFNFMGFLSLQTSVDNPSTENAGASGLIEVLLYDQENGSLLDSLSIKGNVANPSNLNYLTYNKSENFSFVPKSTSFNRQFTSINNDALALVTGYYSRKFTAGANLSLFEVKSNRASVTVPEYNSTLALFGTAAILLVAKVKRKLS